MPGVVLLVLGPPKKTSSTPSLSPSLLQTHTSSCTKQTIVKRRTIKTVAHSQKIQKEEFEKNQSNMFVRIRRDRDERANYSRDF